MSRLSTALLTAFAAPDRVIGTSASGINGQCVGWYDHASRMVRLTLGFRSESNIASNQTIFTVPEQFRPAGNTGGVAIIYNASGAFTAGQIILHADGTITQNISGTTRVGYGFIEYYMGGE